MAESFIGEIRMFGGNFAPQGWAFCSGQLLQIAQYDALFSLIGTTFGGDGQTTFALPDLRGRIPIHRSGTHQQGEAAGMETVPLNANHLPPHSHPLFATTDAAADSSPANKVLAKPAGNIYGAPTNLVSMAANAVSTTGQAQPHDNMQPYLCVSFIISLEGIYPPQN